MDINNYLFNNEEIAPDYQGIPIKDSDEWATPKHIIDALGPFDLDPCAMRDGPWLCAKYNVFKDMEHNGLTLPWHGLVWCNPPYSQKAIWVAKMSVHKSGIMLLPDSTDAPFFHDMYRTATAVLVTRGRIRFHSQNGLPGANPTNGSLFAAYGLKAYRRLKKANQSGQINGTWIKKPRWFV